MESYIQCHYCQKNLTSPLELVCKHTYCSECLTKEVHNEKIICPVCNTEHVAPAASLSSAKPDTLAPYLIGLNSGAPYAIITDNHPPTTQGECALCKKVTDLRTCYHCEKVICTECRTKHYETQKKDVDHSIDTLKKQTDGLIILAQNLNTNRSARIKEYKGMKDQVSVHVKDLTKKIHDEEQDLQKNLDARIQLETEKIAVTEREEQHLQKNKAAFDHVVDKYRDEQNQMILLKMHHDYLASAPVWKQKLETHAGRLNVKKEEELHFHPTKFGVNDSLVGSLTDSKNVNVHAPTAAKRMAAHNDQTESRTCTII